MRMKMRAAGLADFARKIPGLHHLLQPLVPRMAEITPDGLDIVPGRGYEQRRVPVDHHQGIQRTRSGTQSKGVGDSSFHLVDRGMEVLVIGTS